jgi:outer membrane lipoprotein-sorting protein
MRFLLAAESWLPIRAEYYDGSELIRTTHFRDVKTLSGRRLPTVLEVIPADSPEESTRITYEALTLDQPIESNLFTPRGLRRSAHRR